MLQKNEAFCEMPFVVHSVDDGGVVLHALAIFRLGIAVARWLSGSLPEGGLDPHRLIENLPLLLIAMASIKALATFYQWYTWEWVGEQLAKSWRGRVAFAFTSLRLA